MMADFDRYDLPIAESAQASIGPMATYLTRRKRRNLFVIAAIAGVIGLGMSYFNSSYVWFGRSGALMTVASLAHAWAALRWSRMFDSQVTPMMVKAFAKIELNKMQEKNEDAARAIANKRIVRATSGLVTAVNARFVSDHLLIGAIGTLVWGFGDLLPGPLRGG